MPKKIKPKGRKPPKPVTPAKLIWDHGDARRTAYDALFQFEEVLLFATVYGTPGYCNLGDETTRSQFEKIVEYRLLSEYVERCKYDLLRCGVVVPDRWLSLLCVVRLELNAPLDDEDRKELCAILKEVWAVKCRHHPIVLGTRTATAIAKNQSKRPAYSRDHLWLKWHKSGMEYGQIRDRWNGMAPLEREPYAPCESSLGTTKKAGWDTVRKGVLQAKKESES